MKTNRSFLNCFVKFFNSFLNSMKETLKIFLALSVAGGCILTLLYLSEVNEKMAALFAIFVIIPLTVVGLKMKEKSESDSDL